MSFHLGNISQFIGDGSARAHGPERIVLNPSTGQELAKVQTSSDQDIDHGIQLARKAQRDWKRRSGTERSRVLLRASQLLRSQNDRLARLETLDTGKPVAESTTVDIQSAADCLEYFGALAASVQGDWLSQPGAMAYTIREPLGVVGAIGAWNYPLQIAAWKAAPALAMGNAVVFKPSQLTPVTAIELAKIFLEAGLPPGLFSVVQGAADVGSHLSRHPDIAKISLTGSVPTGRRVAATAGENLKKVSLELGGKSPLIVFADANLDEALKGILLGNIFTQGEVCSNGTRVFVHRSVASEVTERLVQKLTNLRIGDPLDPQTQMGALISQEHRHRVLDAVQKGKKEGAHLVFGGQVPLALREDPVLCHGFFMEPALFVGCHDAMTIVREEIFGPVISLLTFEEDDEVLSRANHTEFGLAAGVFTRDFARAHRFAAELEAGIVWINNYNITPVQLPFGGVKNSGIGRENGHAALDDFSQVKSVYVELSQISSPY